MPLMLRFLPRRIAALALCLALLLLIVPQAEAAFWNRSNGRTASSRSNAVALQEVAPPGAAQQLIEELNRHKPSLELLSPAAESLVPAGPWTLRLRIDDWPLLESASLGPGAHVVVQLDGQETVRAFTANAEGVVELTMPALSPGSHRLVAYAALPWGEAVIGREARLSWTLHRGIRNSAALPQESAAQLVTIPAPTLAAGSAMPINWLLLNAPLQHLRPGDDQWRLRLSLEGSSVVLDRAQPLWLSALKQGEHFLQLELLDANGEPLDAPFNSIVLELPVPSSRSGAPAFYRSQLSADELAELSDPLFNPTADEAFTAEELEPEDSKDQSVLVIKDEELIYPDPVIASQEEAVEEEAVEEEAIEEVVEQDINDQTAQAEPEAVSSIDPPAQEPQELAKEPEEIVGADIPSADDTPTEAPS